MSSRRRTPPAPVRSSAAKRALLAGAAIASLWPALALAQPAGEGTPGISPLSRDQRGQVLNQSQTPAEKAKATAPVNTDGLKPGELYMEADQLIRDGKNGITTAEGSVEIRYEDRTLRADRLIYKEAPPPPPGQPRVAQDRDAPAQGVIRAYGHVQVIHDDGTVEYADQMVLDDKMQAGVAIAFAARMHDQRLNQNIEIAGASAVRRSDDIQELNKAIYTPCPICVGDTPKTPTWSITADRVVQDKVRRVIYYRHAKIHILGIPVLYLPVFWHADPSADRQSGLLSPRIGVSSRRGFSYEQPYLLVFNPSADLIISPQINTKANPFLNLHYREAFNSGVIDVRAGYTHEADLDSKGNRFGDNTNRSYVLARGSFKIDDDWIAGFTAERVSDPLLFDKYDIGRVYEARGPYVADDHRLISQAYAIRQDDQSYASVAAFSIQGLRPGDNNRTFPIVAPLVDTHYELPSDIFGGRLRLSGSAVALTRDQSPDSQQLNLPGIDSRRVTAQADWNRTFTSTGGLRVEPFVNLRVDGYSLSDVPVGTATSSNSPTTSRSLSRALGVIGADVSYPVYRRWGDATVVLEPLVQVAASPKAAQVTIGTDPTTGKPIYLDEDSIAFEFDETTLFRANKFPGYDLYEDGLRLNVAGRGSILWDDGRRASLLIGRSFRDSPNTVFSPGSGLTERASDWIVAGDAQPWKGLSFFARTRLDADTLEIHRLEAGANVNIKWGSGYIRYLSDDQGINGTPIKNIDLGGDINLTQHWGLTAYGNRDLQQNAWVIRDLGVFYKDECIRVDVFYRHEDIIVGRLGSSDQLSVRLTLATLGGPIYGR
ncbi:LPS-assembly protein LptD [Phenylobacterium sp.]|uniref:LPS-assembly protein LptD n=1 Tax=Phenylobacterium sp. TaxID=1871053 RepID=UPI003564C6FC